MNTLVSNWKKLGVLCLLFACTVLSSHAQKETYNWVMNTNSGMTWNTTQTIGGMSGLPTPIGNSATFTGIEAISSSEFNNSTTYTYRYTQLSQCGSSLAIAYIYPLKGNISRKTDTIVICKDQELSKYVQLNQIMGLELGGTWSYPSDPDNTILTNIKSFPGGSKYFGALIFDAYKAWSEASSAYSINYKGDAAAKKFVFTYTSPSGNCVDGDLSKTIVLIVTIHMF